ncbi:unnamed protein product [Ixodes hexagonus]
MSFVKWCEYCAAEGIQSPVCLFQISFTEAMQVCKRPECRDLLMAGSIDKLIIHRDLLDLGEKNKVPPKTAGPQVCLPATSLPPKETSCDKADLVEDFLSSFNISTGPPESNPHKTSLCSTDDISKPVVLADCVDGRVAGATKLPSLQEKGEPGAVVPEEDKIPGATPSICSTASLDTCTKPKEELQVDSAISVKLKSEGHNNSVVPQHFSDQSSASLAVTKTILKEEDLLCEVEVKRDAAEWSSIKRDASPCILIQDFVEELVVTEEQDSFEDGPPQELANTSLQLEEEPSLTTCTSTSNEDLGTTAVAFTVVGEASRTERLEATGVGLSDLPVEDDLDVHHDSNREEGSADETAVSSSLRIAESICSLECGAPQSAKSSKAVSASSLSSSMPAETPSPEGHSLLLIGQKDTDSAKELTALGPGKELSNSVVQMVTTVSGDPLVNGTSGGMSELRTALMAGNINASKAGVATPMQATGVSRRLVAVPAGTTPADVLQMLSNGSLQNGIGSQVTGTIISRQGQLQKTRFTYMNGSPAPQQAQFGSTVAPSNSPKRKCQAAGTQQLKDEQVPPQKKAAGKFENDNNHLLSKLALINTFLNSPKSLDVHPNVPPGSQSTNADGQPAIPSGARAPGETSSNPCRWKQDTEPKRCSRPPSSGVIRRKGKKPSNKKGAKSAPVVADLKPVCSPQPSEKGSQSSKLSGSSTSSGFCDSTSSGSETQRRKLGNKGDSTASVSSSMLVRLVRDQVRAAKSNGSGFAGYHPVLAKKPCYREGKRQRTPCRKQGQSAEDVVQADDIDQRVAQLAGSEDLSQFDNVLADLFDELM